jgi:ABC-2 type transport system permease protein
VTTEANAPHQPLGGSPALGSPVGAPVRAPPAIPATRRLYWLLRRELWESRSVYLAPLAVAGLTLLGGLIGALQSPAKLRAAAALAPAQRHEAIAEPYLMVGMLLMATTFVVSIFYSLDALQSERRDRSILFWKSLPVSDLATVLSKATIPVVILPLLTVVLAVVVQALMLLLSSAVLLADGQGVATLWAQVALPEMSLMLLYHMVTVHALWYAPIYAWLLLVSAWSQRAAWLWASLPPLAIAIVEHIAFDSSQFANLLMHRMGGGAEGTDYTAASGMMDPLMQMTPGRFLGSAGLWVGLAVTAAFLAVAVRLRRQRGPV